MSDLPGVSRVCVYCASSRDAHPDYYDAARRLGEHLASRSVTIYYGGGAVGSMGHLADGAIAAGGEVVGVLPDFMDERELGHNGLTELRIVASMHERKFAMLENSQAAIALPGGCGTLEEVFEAITWRRLCLYDGPIVIVNTRGFFDPCRDLLEHCVEEGFMQDKHREIWRFVDEPEDVLEAIQSIRGSVG